MFSFFIVQGSFDNTESQFLKWAFSFGMCSFTGMLHNVLAVVLLENTSYITHMQVILYMGEETKLLHESRANEEHKTSHTSEGKHYQSRAQAGDTLWWSQGSSHPHTAQGQLCPGSQRCAGRRLPPSDTQVVPLPRARSTNTKLSSRPRDVGYSADGKRQPSAQTQQVSLLCQLQAVPYTHLTVHTE